MARFMTAFSIDLASNVLVMLLMFPLILTVVHMVVSWVQPLWFRVILSRVLV